jgi:hypothetical protein
MKPCADIARSGSDRDAHLHFNVEHGHLITQAALLFAGHDLWDG